MTYTVVLNNPAQPNANWTEQVEAANYTAACVVAKARWGKYVLYVRHNNE
jgi:hypothetical protein